uniref:Glutathione hydrolase-like YwrD proenzyme n=1 Tax=Cynoglossus semilaevis TaxID=244447 RepID=A0A3P8WU46_CYNSE
MSVNSGKKMDHNLSFSSRRSPVVCLHGSVASSQPLATDIGLDILKRGGNAADAAVAIAAALAVTEPFSTGPGGDAFCLFYNANNGEITGINGSGHSPQALTLDLLKSRGYCEETPPSSFDVLNVTVPGAPACWWDTVQQFGSDKLSFQEVLSGAVELAEVGFPVAEVTAVEWAKGVAALREDGKELGGDLLVHNQAPKCGQVFRNQALARTLKELGEGGKPAFYEGRVAQAIVDVTSQHGGVMTLNDLCSHESEIIRPISTDYKGVSLWEPPPNSQGLATLLMLDILENFPLKVMSHNSSDYVHTLVEAVRLALTDAMCHLADPDHMTLPVETLLDKGYSRQRGQHIQMERSAFSCDTHPHGCPGMLAGSDTVYLCVIDSQGNACSFVNSLYMSFGTGLVPKDCGFSLQNRGANFSLHPNHVNCVGGRKRSYHTIMAALLTTPPAQALKPQLLAALGVMGGFMQTQGHVQVVLNMVEFGMNPQQALDAPRVFVAYNQKSIFTLHIQTHTLTYTQCGPICGHNRAKFGRGQIITVGDWWNGSDNQTDGATKVLWAGSDPRADGCALGY